MVAMTVSILDFTLSNICGFEHWLMSKYHMIGQDIFSYSVSAPFRLEAHI